MQLSKDMILYHSSYTEVKDINLNLCNKGLDFGKGFYLTTSYEQAKNYVKLSINKAKRNMIVKNDISYGFINKYKIINIDDLKLFFFEKPDYEWLHYVVSNRDNTLFSDINEKYSIYNVIYGKIANDKTTLTINGYIDGLFGDINDVATDDTVLKMLLPNKLDNQLCFKDGKAIESLKFVESEKIYV